MYYFEEQPSSSILEEPLREVHNRLLLVIIQISLPHQAGIELSDFHARVWKSDQGGQNSMQEMHGNQTKCM